MDLLSQPRSLFICKEILEAFDLRLWSGFQVAGGDANHPAIVDQIVIDSRRIDSSASLFVALQGTQDGHHFVSGAINAGCRYILVRKDWERSFTHPYVNVLRVDCPLKAFQEIALAYREWINVPIVGIIGSYGKTMVKDLLAAMLQESRSLAISPESFNSQIGVPLSLLTMSKKHDLALIEAAFSKPKEMDALIGMIHPSYAVLTNIGERHAATMGSRQAIAGEFSKFLQVPPHSQWVLFPKSPYFSNDAHAIRAKQYHWNIAEEGLPHARQEESRSSRTLNFSIAFPDGTHYRHHATSGFPYFMDLLNTVIKAAWLLGIPSERIREVLSIYTPEPMRTEIWKTHEGITFINDTYCSDPQSIDCALAHFMHSPPEGRRIFVFHGMRDAKEREASLYRRIAKTLKKAPLDTLYLIGVPNDNVLIDELDLLESEIKIFRCTDLQEACHHLCSRLQRGDVVLFKGANKYPLEHITTALEGGITNNHYYINLSAIKANLESLARKLPKKTGLMVMVKALAYGTDEIRMAHFFIAQGVDILGVSYVDEGVLLRKAGIKSPIFVINAGVYEAAKAVKWQLEIGISEELLLNALEQEAQRAGTKVKVHLHVDTGMSRFGCRPKEALRLAQRISSSKDLELEGLMTHFAASEDPAQDLFTATQAEIFTQVIDNIKAHGIHPKWLHAANSGGVLRFAFPQFNMARIGLAVYGLHASESTRLSTDLELAFSLVSRIVGINVCKEGETVSYGRAYKISRPEQKIAVLPIGYFDGLHRNYSGKGYVMVRGQKAPMVGRITMDYMMIDVTEIPNVEIGDPVLLFGEDEFGNYISPEHFAFEVESIPHELITCLGPRIQRVFIYEETQKKTLGANDGFLSTSR